MRKVTGTLCIILGILCLLASVGFVFYNRMEEVSAETSSQTMLHTVQEKIARKALEAPVPDATEQPLEEEFVLIEETQEIPAVNLDGYDCIGILSLPALGLELPVLSNWSYAKLKIAPCQYYGSCYDTDFVIAAHNYRSHFGRLSELRPQDLILFTDANGDVFCYEVVLTETLPPTATKEMITSGFDLSLYTCTPGGGSRVTVRCRKI